MAASTGYNKMFPVSWTELHRDARALAWRLAASGPFTTVVAITRGGLVPAAIVARELNVRMIETVCVSSYHNYTTQGDLRVIKNVADAIVKLDGAGVLIVDDLVDTGKAFSGKACVSAMNAPCALTRRSTPSAAGRRAPAPACPRRRL